MRICFPVESDQGVDSQVFGHFGSAPIFVVVDSETEVVNTINNRDVGHVHGNCSPIKALDGNNVDAIVVGGIGAGAINKFNAMGIKVFKAESGTVKDNLSMISESKLPELTTDQACGGHRQSGGCSH